MAAMPMMASIPEDSSFRYMMMIHIFDYGNGWLLPRTKVAPFFSGIGLGRRSRWLTGASSSSSSSKISTSSMMSHHPSHIVPIRSPVSLDNGYRPTTGSAPHWKTDSFPVDAPALQSGSPNSWQTTSNQSSIKPPRQTGDWKNRTPTHWPPLLTRQRSL